MEQVDKDQVQKRLRDLLESDLADVETTDVDETTPLLTLGILDSFGLLRFISHIESEFKIQVPLEKLTLDDVKDLNALSHLVTQLLQARQ